MSLDYNYHSSQKIGFARPTFDHQLFIGEFYYRIREILKDTDYLVLTEEVFDKRNLKSDLVPDVIVYDTLNDHYPVFFIEITKSRGLNKCFKKLETIYARYPDIEAFIFDFDELKWIAPRGNSKSTLLNIDISELISEKEVLDIINKARLYYADAQDSELVRRYCSNKIGINK